MVLRSESWPQRLRTMRVLRRVFCLRCVTNDPMVHVRLDYALGIMLAIRAPWLHSSRSMTELAALFRIHHALIVFSGAWPGPITC